MLSRLDVARASRADAVELERGDARFVAARRPLRARAAGGRARSSTARPASSRCSPSCPTSPAPRGYRLPELAPLPAPPLHRVRRLSYSALALFERCSYRYYAERVAGLREERGTVAGGAVGLKATEIGDAVHRLLELVDLAAPARPDVELVRTWYPDVTDEELARIEAFVDAYCESELAARIATLPGAAAERPFAFEHDGVLLHGRLDVLWRDGTRALVLDYKTNSLAEGTPEEIVESRLPAAAARLRARLLPRRRRRGRGRLPLPRAARRGRRRRRSRGSSCRRSRPSCPTAIRRIDAGEFVPTPSEFTCSGCPALDVVCAGPRLRNPSASAVAAVQA